MKAILVREFGSPDVLKLEEVPTPKPAAGEVLVRIHAAGVNPYDTYMRAGTYARKPPLPYTPGSDGAGVVETVGEGVKKVKRGDYRLEGPDRYKVMTLATHEFIRRFLIHVLPAGFHRIRYYGLLASGKRAENVARARELLMPPIIPVDAIKANSSPNAAEPQTANLCPCCGGRMITIERFERGATPHYRPSAPTPAVRIDTS
jgi:Putative transposase/Alcohol dehydrogenase GroES-like domain